MNISRVAPARLWLVLCAGLIVLKLWLVSAQPIVAIGPAGHDDQLYLRLAQNILQGRWLGTYDQYTLAKGPMYPIWIAGTVLAHVPLRLAEHLLYLVACLTLVRALRPVLPSSGAAAAVFLLLWWNPMSYEMATLGRVLRQNFYTPTTLLLFASSIALYTRRHAPRGIRLGWGALLGGSGAALWLTREESAWVVPSIVLLVLAAVWFSWRSSDRPKRLVAPLTTAATAAAAIMLTVCTLNARYYGWFGTVEYRAPAFISAYGALQRIVSSYEVSHYVPVTREARERAYTVSPAFAELKPYLEGAVGSGWAAASAPWIGVPPEQREMGGGWFMWALRDAVAAAGYTRDAGHALDFYQRAADEINHACDAGRIAARPRRDTLMPPWRPVHTQRLKENLPESLAYFFTFRGFIAFPPPSVGPAFLLPLFRDMTRGPLSFAAEAPELTHAPTPSELARMVVLRVIGKVFRWTIGALAIAAVGAWAFILWRGWRTRAFSYLATVTTAALGGALAVVLINTLVDVLSFPNRSTGSFAQAYPLLLLFAALAWIEACLPAASVLPARQNSSTGSTT